MLFLNFSIQCEILTQISQQLPQNIQSLLQSNPLNLDPYMLWKIFESHLHLDQVHLFKNVVNSTIKTYTNTKLDVWSKLIKQPNKVDKDDESK
jgi:hypothetical protein